MPQIFPPGANTLGRLLFYGAAPALLFAWFIGYELYTSSYVDRVGVAVVQPVPFSHRHHAGELGIDCRYCHVSVEASSFAGVPSSRTCMTCHSQIWTKNAPILEPVRESFRGGEPVAWRRVTTLPDYVYFDHSIHIAKGLACAQCHGAVDDMPLTSKAVAFRMKDCLECHRDHVRVAGAERPRLAVAQYLETLPRGEGRSTQELTRLIAHRGLRKATDCYTCHR